MRRLLLAVALLLIATASPTFAGYIIIRVLLDDSGAGGTTTPGPGTPGPGPGRPGPGGPGSSSSGPGGPPMPPTSGGGNTPGATAPEADPTQSIVVVVPLEAAFEERPLIPGKASGDFYPNNPKYRKFTFTFYDKKLTGGVYVDSVKVQLYAGQLGAFAERKTRASEVRDKYQLWAAGKSDPVLLYNAFIAALEAGQVPEALTYAQELTGLDATKTAALPDRAKTFVTSWKQMADQVIKAPLIQNDADSWSQRLGDTQVYHSKHYSLIYWDTPAAIVERHGAQLDNHFAAFFLWHATQGIVLPVPATRLLVVLAKPGFGTSGRHHLADLRTGLDAPDEFPKHDAFYSSEHDLLVLASDRTDPIGATFVSQNALDFDNKGLKRHRILAGELPPIDHTGQKGARPDDVVKAGTFALVEQLTLDESQIASITREGTRQLMFATGLMPRYVTLPQWLSNGSLHFFTRPRGPAYVNIPAGDDEKPHMSVALSPGYGVPNFLQHRYLRDLADHKELPADWVRLLENVLTDAYFTGIKDGIDPDPAPPKKKKKPAPGTTPGMGDPGMGSPGPGRPVGGQPPMPPMYGGMPGTGMQPPPPDDENPVLVLRKTKERLAIKAHATSWALYYYLASARPAELKAYLAELNKLPRDLPIDGKTAYDAFVRTFQLSGKDGRPDPTKMKAFAEGWRAYMGRVSSVHVYDIPLQEPKKPDPTSPMGPMGTPMGSPGGVRP